MAQELMWVCAIAPEEFRKAATQLCLTENKAVGLPENVFKLPLHVSLKESFYTDSFDDVRVDILKTVNSTGRFHCYINRVILQRNMLWLSLINDGNLRHLHEDLDRMLEKKYDIPISRHDRIFQPHISLFTRGTSGQMQTMYGRLKELDFGGDIEINRFVIGSSGHKDEFFDLK